VIDALLVSEMYVYKDVLAEALSAEGTARVAALATSEAQIRRCLADHSFDVVLLQLLLPNGAGLARLIRREAPSVPIVVIDVPDSISLSQWTGLGIRAWVGRSSSFAELVEAIAEATRDQYYCSSDLRAAFLALTPPAGTEVRALTSRESEIVQLIAAGLTNSEIASKLGIAHSTVKNHVHSILGKLRLRDRSELRQPRTTNGWL
jgi:DNA-binding NarL/FixJ family response regulator